MLKKSDPHSSAKAIIALLIVGLAFAILLIFYRNKDAILSSDSFRPFVFLVFLGSLLLLTLLFLVNKPMGSNITRRTKSRKKR